jgi:hypothetical protein
MAYRVLIVAVVAVHFAFLAFVVLGGFVAVRRPGVVWAHLVAVAWGVAIVAAPGVLCPLTVAENWARHRAGWSSYTGGFIDRYVEGVLYPARFTPLVQALVAVAVLGSWTWCARARRARSPGPADRRT